MGKHQRKIMAALKARQDAWQATQDKGNTGGFRKPGSQNAHKTGLKGKS